MEKFYHRTNLANRLLKIFFIAITLLCISFLLILLPRLAEGTLWHTDEAYTAERSREMLLLGDYSTVHLYFKPNFNKPPLQYYLTTLSMRLISDRELSVRIWSLIYAVGCLALVPFVYLQLAPTRWFEALLSAAFTATYPHFIDNARIGLLDMGLTFFLLLTLLGTLRAISHSPMWILGGVAAGLGLWQKNAVPLLAFLLMLSWHLFSCRSNLPLKNKWIILGVLAALFIGLTWPILQWARYPTEYIKAFQSDYARLTLPDRYVNPRDYFLYFKFLISKWNLFAVVALFSLIAFFWKKELRNHPPYLRLVTIIVAYLAFISLCAFKRNYYLVPVIPLFAILGVYFLSSCLGKRPFLLFSSSILLLSLTFASSSKHFVRPSKDYSLQVSAIEEVLSGAQSNEKLCFIYTPGHFESIESLFPAFVLYYGQLNQPVDVHSLPSLRNLPPLTRVRGVIHVSNLTALNPLLTNLHFLATYGDYRVFYAKRAASVP